MAATMMPHGNGEQTDEGDKILKAFMNEVYDTSRDAEVERILQCFKLNPFEHLNVRFDATDDDINKKFRQISLMVHPDKCTHPKAKEAFEALGEARKFLNDSASLTAFANFS